MKHIFLSFALLILSQASSAECLSDLSQPDVASGQKVIDDQEKALLESEPTKSFVEKSLRSFQNCRLVRNLSTLIAETKLIKACTGVQWRCGGAGPGGYYCSVRLQYECSGGKLVTLTGSRRRPEEPVTWKDAVFEDLLPSRPGSEGSRVKP